MLPQVCSVHICTQAPSARTGTEDTNAHGFVVQTCRWYKSVLLPLSLIPIQAGHKAWTDKYVDLRVYPAIWAAQPGGCALHTFLAWWMLQLSCQPSHPKHKLEHHQVSIHRKLSEALEERLWAAQRGACSRALLNQLGLTHFWLMRGAGHDCKLIFSSGYPCTQVSVLIKLTSAQLMLMDSTATYARSSVTQLR